MSDPEWLLFPVRNEEGFRVEDLVDYQHMINTIVEAQVELATEYPGKKILVVYLAELEEREE